MLRITSTSKSDPVVPGEINEYNVDLGKLTNVFRAGHRIKLEIQSLESPRDPEMQIHYHPHLPSSRTTLHKIYRNKEYPSHLVLPIVGKKEHVMEFLSDENLVGALLGHVNLGTRALLPFHLRMSALESGGEPGRIAAAVRSAVVPGFSVCSLSRSARSISANAS